MAEYCEYFRKNLDNCLISNKRNDMKIGGLPKSCIKCTRNPHKDLIKK